MKRQIAARMTGVILMLPLMSTTALAEVWIAEPEIIPGANGGETVFGFVFEDANGDGRHDDDEDGIEGVIVSNGLDVTTTDADGRYEIEVRQDMDLSIVQPSGWRVPTDERLVPQFSYVHKQGGTPGDFRFGGLDDTGPAPEQVNFPLQAMADADAFKCVMMGDSQAYSGHETSMYRDSAVTDLLGQEFDEADCLFYIGDVTGDDLDLLDRIFEVGAAAGLPQWAVAGNHDYDFDAESDADSLDSWRRIWGPANFAFEIGDILFVGLDNIIYPCGADEAAAGPGREACETSETPRYSAGLSDDQITWLENVLAEVDEDKTVVIAHHAPIVSFADASSGIHQTDNAAAFHAALEGREALSISGHTHSTENHAPGQSFEGWEEYAGVTELPFRHIVAGAASGNWWQGDFNIDGDAQSFQRDGAPKGWLLLEFDGADYTERYFGSRMAERAQWVDFNTPAFREWYDTLIAWRDADEETRDSVPPVTVHDLADTHMFTPTDLEEGVWVTVNFWHGSAEAEVSATIDGGDPIALARTQQGEGEAVGIGAEYADPYALQVQATIGRMAFESTSGEDRNQGYESFRGSVERGSPSPQGNIADRSMHLWTADLPADLEPGVHTLEVTSTDRNGEDFVERVIFEVRQEIPPMRHRTQVW